MPTSKKIESGLSRINELMRKHAAGAITAYLHKLPEKENIERNRKLLAVLMSLGYRAFSVKGEHIINFATPEQDNVWVEYYFVVDDKVEGDDGGELERELVELGKVFDQKRVLSIRKGISHLVGTSTHTDAYPPFGQILVSDVATLDAAYGDFFSFVAGERLMYEDVSEVEELLYPGTINGIRVMKMYTLEVKKSIDERKQQSNILPFRQK